MLAALAGAIIGRASTFFTVATAVPTRWDERARLSLPKRRAKGSIRRAGIDRESLQRTGTGVPQPLGRICDPLPSQRGHGRSVVAAASTGRAPRPPATQHALADPSSPLEPRRPRARVSTYGLPPTRAWPLAALSRPPADYRLAYQGRYSDVWRRTSTPQVLEHISLGSGLYQDAVPSCRMVLATGRRAAHDHARLAYVPRAPLPMLVPPQAAHPSNWPAIDPDELVPRQQVGAVTGMVRVQHPGRYQVWLDGSSSQRFQVWVGRQYVGSVAYELGPPGSRSHRRRDPRERRSPSHDRASKRQPRTGR